VRSVDRVLADGRECGGLPLKPYRDKDGYRYVTLRDGQRAWRVHVARLVLIAHAGEPPAPGMEADHRNGRRWDNRLANLCWATDAENSRRREELRMRRTVRRTGREEVRDEKERETSEIGKQDPTRRTAVSPVAAS
jgi:hypothetical protein